ncbi:SMR domain-containing protein [Quillaja saponaria]|uniref:SMR domain-containing protein n=1 Tax=Quillaja saponaria TaxID=32244 RepID=A0AAD7KZ72_QUISA|nr:SMR domain-containing protein [Quillaja saponaria]
MKMQAYSSHTECSDNQDRDLEWLLEVFGSAFSLEDIASAYFQARSNVDVAGEILSASQGTTSNIGTSASSDKVEVVSETTNLPSESGESALSSKMSSANESQNVIGKNYVRPKISRNECPEAKKPLKLDATEIPIFDVWSEEASLSKEVKSCSMSNDLEGFLFEMLGYGFQLDRNVIQEVLGHCGYDVQKTMDKLLDMSASTLEKCDDLVGLAGENSAEKCPDIESAPCEGASITTKTLPGSPKKDNERFGLQKEILEALFTVPERPDELPKRTRLVRETRRSRPCGKPVVELPSDTILEHKIVAVEPQAVIENDDENGYEVLRRGVKEYWITMKEYYRAAFEAFTKGDHERADKLLQQGHFFNSKAREADEKSAHMLLETRDDEVSLDLHLHEPREALQLLRLHLTNLSGTLAFTYLKVIVGTDDEDTKKGARKRLIIKQLDKESIKWTEEDNGRVIRIQLDVINPKRLSFYKK